MLRKYFPVVSRKDNEHRNSSSLRVLREHPAPEFSLHMMLAAGGRFVLESEQTLLRLNNRFQLVRLVGIDVSRGIIESLSLISGHLCFSVFDPSKLNVVKKKTFHEQTSDERIQ